jgi:outer membrane protein TolC
LEKTQGLQACNLLFRFPMLRFLRRLKFISAFLLKGVFLLILLICSKPIFAQQDVSYYVAAAKKRSPLVQDNRNQSKANLLEADRLRAQYKKLQVNLTANYLFAPIINRDRNTSSLDLNSSGADQYSGYDIAASNGGQYQAMINFTQPLFSGQRAETYATQALIASEINRNNVHISEHDVEKFVGDQYILCLQDKQQLQFTDTLLNILKEQQSIQKKLSENGLGKQSDLSLLTIEVQTQLNARVTFLTTYKRDLLDLNVLCGIEDTTVVILPDIALQMQADTVVSRYLHKYQLDSLNLIAQQKIFENRYKPLVSAYGNGGLNAVYAPTIPNRFGISAGLSLTWTIADGHQRNINQQKTSALMQSVSVYKDYFISQNEVRKKRILNELQGLEQRAKILQDQLKEYRTLMSYYGQELMQGQLPIINYISVLKTMATQQRDYFLLQTNRQLLINMYNYWNW